MRTAETVIFTWTMAVVIAAGVALAAVGVSVLRPSSYLSNASIYFSAWVLFVCVHIARDLLRDRPASPIAYVRSMFDGEYMQAAWRGLPLVLAATLFMPAFSAVKSAIPLLNDYTWDRTFIALDRAIHGTDVWITLQPWLGHPLITAGLGLSYHAWFQLIYCGTIYFAVYEKNRYLAARYFIAYFATWTIGGMVLAVGLASVGPCFVKPLLGMDTFAEQMAYLAMADKAYPVMVLDVQQQLLAWHSSGQHGLGRGITAMPSMHVALAFLFFLAMCHVSRWAGLAFGLFFVAIFLGSIHLGYHYAVDGYVSILLVAVLWQISGIAAAPWRSS